MTHPTVIDLPTQATHDAVRTRDRGPIVAYDFRRPTKVSRDHLRSLQVAFETFARRLTTLLTSGLRQVCQVTVGDVSQRSYDDYISALTGPTMLVPLDIPPLAGTGTLQFSLPVTLAAIDHMLGGPGGQQPTRTLTDIEMTLLRGLLSQIIDVLRYAIEPLVPLAITAGEVEYNPQFLQAAGAADAMIVGEFEIAIGQQRSPLTISLPLAPLLPTLNAQRRRESGASSADQQAGAARMQTQLGELPLEVALRFDPVALRPDRILSLAVDDIVPLRHRVGVPLTVHAGGVGFAHAVAGRAGNQLAALVVDSPRTFVKEHQ